MRRLASLVVVSLVFLGSVGRAEDSSQYPLGHSRVTLRKGTVAISATWAGPRGSMFNPQAVTSTLAIAGGSGHADGSPVTLVPAKWKTLRRDRGYRYHDPKGTAGGIKSVVLLMNGSGGTLKVRGGGGGVPYSPATTPADITVTLTIGTARWCAVATETKRTARMVRAESTDAPASCPCVGSGTSTWQAIQTNIIERYGCAATACHTGPTPQGGLDLNPDVAFANLVGVASQADPTVLRVKRAARSESMLWLKLAKKTQPDAYGTVPGSPMPSNGFTLSAEELEAVRLWIQAGAPEEGVVDGTDRLLAACLPPPDPIKITPPPVPAVGDGVQFYSPPWPIKPFDPVLGQNGEDEICQATFYDFSDRVPAEVRLSKDDPRCRYWTGRCSNDNEHCTEDADCNGGGTCAGREDCFFFNHTELTQDPNSHHSIIHIYRGRHLPGSAEWTQGFGPFRCREGARANQACDPTGSADQCPDSTCAGRVHGAVACVFYGPDDYTFDVTGGGAQESNAPSIGGSQQPYSELNLPAGVYGVYPIRGTMVWNSHAFNTTSQPTTNEQYFNVFFAKTEADRREMVKPIFDASHIFVQLVPPFERREYCATFTLHQGAQLTSLSSHTHKRGLLFRIWMPPNQPCGACANEQSGIGGSGCEPDPACRPNPGPPLASTTTYNDPVQIDFAEPWVADAADVASRTVKFCSIFDNGFTNPADVKLQSRSPATDFGGLAPGGPCKDDAVACVNGPKKGQKCGGNDRVCDSASGANDGICDACPLRGGVTTEDEMYILIGQCTSPERTCGVSSLR